MSDSKYAFSNVPPVFRDNTYMSFRRKNRTSKDYVVTVQHKTEKGQEFIESLRRVVKQSFKDAKTVDPGAKKHRVVLMPRLGPDNPNAHKYRGRTGPLYVKLEDSAYVDVYIYEDRSSL